MIGDKAKWYIVLTLALMARLALVGYGHYQDHTSLVPYTDIDYKVFTDAARYMNNGLSPFLRSTYRYSPLVAFFCIPNTFLPCFGKLLFMAMDLANGVLLSQMVKKERRICTSLFWLLNPFSMIISTRGNCDSFAVFLVLITVYLIERNQYAAAGFMHGISVHFRIYPVIYTITFFNYLSLFIWTPNDSLFRRRNLYYFKPNKHQFTFISACVGTFSGLLMLFSALYGYEFVEQTYLYHFSRKDPKHNFSLYFYLQYLSESDIVAQGLVGLWQKLLCMLPQLVLIVVFPMVYAWRRRGLQCMHFSLLCQTAVFVIYNSVLTSQYFVWIMALLPLCQFEMEMWRMSGLFALWLLAQGAWLLPAYLLEFHGFDTYWYIWLQCVSFFCVNIYILNSLIVAFNKALCYKRKCIKKE